MSGARRFFWCVLRLGFAYPKKYKLEKERNTMNKVEDFINTTKLNDLLNKKEELINMTKLNELLNKKEAEEKKTSKVVWIFAIIGIIAAVAAAVYGVYRFFTPDYLEDFEDDFEDDYDDDFFEDEEDEEEPAKRYIRSSVISQLSKRAPSISPMMGRTTRAMSRLSMRR